MGQSYSQYGDEKKELISDFNEAKFQILRLHLLWQSCNSLSQSGKLIQWKWKLDTMWRELSVDATEKDNSIDKDKDKYFTRVKELNKNIAIAQDNNNREELYDTLQQKEIFLRQLQEDAGKGSRKHAHDEDDMDD